MIILSTLAHIVDVNLKLDRRTVNNMSTPFDRVANGLKYLVVHHTASEAPLLESWNPYGYDYPEYDYGVDLDGTFRVGRPLTVKGAHCLPDNYPYNEISMNQKSIGFVLAGSFDKRKALDNQINQAAYNIGRICKKYGLPISRESIIPHFKASATFCPGKNTIDRIYKKLGI